MVAGWSSASSDRQWPAEAGEHAPESVELVRNKAGLTAFINANEAGIIDGTFEIPLAFQGQPFRAASSLVAPPTQGFKWLAPPTVNNNEARFKVAFGSCNGCHHKETATDNFVHVDNRRRTRGGAPSSSPQRRWIGLPSRRSGQRRVQAVVQRFGSTRGILKHAGEKRERSSFTRCATTAASGTLTGGDGHGRPSFIRRQRRRGEERAHRESSPLRRPWRGAREVQVGGARTSPVGVGRDCGTVGTPGRCRPGDVRRSSAPRDHPSRADAAAERGDAPDGRRIPVDVLQRNYKPSTRWSSRSPWRPGRGSGAAETPRRRRLDRMKPGISVRNIAASPARSARRFDRQRRAVRAEQRARAANVDAPTDETVFQPGPETATSTPRSGRCAQHIAWPRCASRHHRPLFESAILELDVRPQRIARAEPTIWSSSRPYERRHARRGHAHRHRGLAQLRRRHRRPEHRRLRVRSAPRDPADRDEQGRGLGACS